MAFTLDTFSPFEGASILFVVAGGLMTDFSLDTVSQLFPFPALTLESAEFLPGSLGGGGARLDGTGFGILWNQENLFLPSSTFSSSCNWRKTVSCGLSGLCGRVEAFGMAERKFSAC